MNLIEIYNSIDLNKIEQFIKEGKEENLQLDFKEINNPDLTHKDDKKNFARALSGFANSSGGIIVWGVKANKNKEGIDCAQDKALIQNVPLFISRLNEFTGIAVNPIIDGVLHKSIIENNIKGFVITYIPESDSGPHMAKFSEDRYYKRSGDSLYKMEHFDIEDMFGRRKKPSLEMISEVTKLSTSRSEPGIIIMIKLFNNGRGTAKAPFLEIEKPINSKWSEYGYDGNGSTGLNGILYYPTAPIVSFGSDGTTVIHPGISLTISKLLLHYDSQNIRDEIKDITIKYKVASEDLKLQEKLSEIKKDDLIQII